MSKRTPKRPGVLAFIGRVAHHHAGKVVALFALSVLPALFIARDLQLREDFGELLPDGYPATEDLNIVAEKIGGTAFMVVAVDASDPDRAKRFADALAPRLNKLEGVLYTEGRVDVNFLKDRGLLFLSEQELRDIITEVKGAIRRVVTKRSGFYIDLEEDDEDGAFSEDFATALEGQTLPIREYMIGDDGRYLFMPVRLRGYSGDLEFSRNMVRTVRQEAEALRATADYPDDLELRYTGSVVIRDEEHDILTGDLKLASILGFVMVVGLIVLYTRRPRALILVGVPLLIAISWMLAFAKLAVGHLNVMTGFLVAILFGLGIDFSVHLFLRIVEERVAGRSPEQASLRSVVFTGRAVAFGAVTTAVAFFMLQVAEFKGYTEFGLIAGAAILFTMVLSLFLVPALNQLINRVRPLPLPARTPLSDEGIHIGSKYRTAFLIAVALFAVNSVIQLVQGNVDFRTNWRELKGESPASDFDDYMVESLGGSFSLTAVYLPDPSQAPRLTEAVNTIKARRERAGKPSGVTHVVGLSELVPPNQTERKVVINELRAELERIPPKNLERDERKLLKRALTLTEAVPFTLDELPDSITRRFKTVDGEGTVVFLLTRYLFYELQEIIEWADELFQIRTEVTEQGAQAYVLSENWLLGTVLGIVINDGPAIVWAAIFAILLVLIIDFRSIKHALIVVAPLVLGVVCIAGGMSVFGVRLNLINAVIIPSIVGIGIDDAIHIYHRYLEEGPGSVPTVLRHASSATLLASLTTMLGFGAMIVAHHKGIRSVAQLAIIGISLTWLTTCVFFPLALQAWESRFRSPAEGATMSGVEGDNDNVKGSTAGSVSESVS